MTTSRNDPTRNEFADMMTSTNKRDGGEVELLPLPPLGECSENSVREWCRANVERALAESRADAATEKGRREHTQQWYAERLAKIEEVAKREGLWPEIAAIIANGSGTRQLPNGSYVYDPPTYAQQLNSAKHKAERAEARAERLAGALRWIDSDETAKGANDGMEEVGAIKSRARAALEQEPQE